MDAQLLMRPFEPIPDTVEFTVTCPHGAMARLVAEHNLRWCRRDMTQLITDRLETRLHEVTGCVCTVPRRGDMAEVGA